MGSCFQDDKKKKNTWGNSNQNQNRQDKEQNNQQNNDHNYIMQKREAFFQSNEFKKKQIFKNE